MTTASISATDGRQLSVRRSGTSGPVMVIAHGAGSSATFIEEAFAAPVVAAGWQLVALDLRGHGDSSAASDPEDHTLDRHAADIAQVARAVDACVVGGVSMGGMASVRAAAREDLDVIGVVAVIPGWTGAAVAGQGPHAAIADEIRRDGVRGVMARLQADTSMLPWIREVVLRDYARHDEASLTASLMALDGGDAPTLEEVASLKPPLALVGWPDDPGHPLDVAQSWSSAKPQSALSITSMQAMQRDRTSFGRAALASLYELGLTGGC